jgi:GAF domain-containing protein
MKYMAGPADYEDKFEGGNPAQSFVSAAVSATGASAACLYLVSGQSLVRFCQHPEDARCFMEEIKLTDDVPAARCLQTGLDWSEPGHCVERGGSGVEYAFPLFSGEEAIGSIELRDVDTNVPGWDRIISLLKETATIVADSSLGRLDAETALEINLELSKFLSYRGDHLSTKYSLSSIAEWIRSKFGLVSVSLVSPVLGKLQTVCLAGSSSLNRAMDDAVKLALEEGRSVRKTQSADGEHNVISTSVVPVGSDSNGRIAVLLESEYRFQDEAEDIAARAFSAALELISHEFNSYAFWVDIVESIDDAVLISLRQSQHGASEMIDSIFRALVSKGYILSYSVFSKEELFVNSGAEGDSPAISAHPDASDSAEAEACRDAIGSLGIRFVINDSSRLAISIVDGSGHAWAVVIRMNWPVILPSELATWNRMSSVFGMLLRTFMSRIVDGQLMERVSRLENRSEQLYGACSSIFSSSSAREAVAAVNAFIRKLDNAMSAAYYGEGHNFHRLDDGEGARVVFPSSLLESMLTTSKPVAKYIYEISQASFSDMLLKLFPESAGRTYYILTAEDENDACQCFVIFAIPSPRTMKGILLFTLMDLSLYLNIKTALIRELLTAKTDSKLIGYARELLEHISRAENTGKILKRIVDASAAITNSPMAVFALRNLSSGKETIGISRGYTRIPHTGKTSSLSHGIVGRVLRSGEPEIVNDYQNDPDALQEHIQLNKIERVACVPVNISIKEKGYIAVLNTDDHRYSQAHIKSLRTLSNLASLAIRLNGSRMERSMLLSDFDHLQDAEIALFSSRSMYALLQTLAMETKLLASATDVILVSEINGTKRTICSTSSAIDDGSVVYDASVIGMQFDHQPHVTRVVETVRMEEEWASRLDIKEVLMVKVPTDENIVIVAFNKQTGTSFDEGDTYKIAKLSRIASAAIDKVHLVERLNRQLKHIEIMHMIVNGVIQGKGEEELMKETMPKVVEIIDGDLGLLWKHDRERNKNVVISEFYRTPGSENLLGQEVDAEKGITGTVFRTRKPLLVTNAATDNYAVQIQGTKRQSFETVIAAPLMIHDEMLGVLTVYRDTPPPFNTAELNIISNLSNDISLVMAKYSTAFKGLAGSDTGRQT